jgi:CRP-like cAMP-binding protein
MSQSSGGSAAEVARKLGAVVLFGELTARERLEIAESMQVRKCPTGRQVIRHGDSSSDVYFVLDGHLRATVFSLGGREIAYEELGPGAMFGEVAAIDGGPRTTHVVALTPCLLASLPAAAFLDMLGRHPAAARAAMRRLVSTIRSLAERVFEFSTLPVRGRVVAEILRLAHLAGAAGGPVSIADFPTHSQLASRISTHREAVTRELASLSRSGLVRRRGRTLFVDDLDRLAEVLRTLQ